ncbi:MAG: hypothetical protein R3F24_05620 [Gammaproteobacteria bacterium]
MLVGADGITIAQPVELGALIEGRWVISTGLKPGDRVIVEGWQKVRPGQKVQVRNKTDAATDVASASTGSEP